MVVANDPEKLIRTEMLDVSGLRPGDAVDSQTKFSSLEVDTKTIMGGVEVEVSEQDIAMLVGQKIGKYEIRSQLGSGGMGAVYLAFDPLIEREVALKVLSMDLSGSSVALQRFLGEARAIGRLNHPNVVSIYDIDQWNGQYYLVMELLTGGSVAGRVESLGKMSWEEACRIIAQASRGLAAAHEAGMIHRDIKPENLMLAKDGQVKVVDFGLSKLLDATNDPQNAVTKAGQILGTPQYMSPEQFEAAELDARTDIYSLGATLFRLLTSRFPFHDCKTIIQVMTAHMTKPAPVPTSFEPSVPPEFNRIIERAMAKSPADRYQTAAELATELEALLHRPAQSVPATQGAADISDRPLMSAVIVEPSKLQGTILKDALRQAGVRDVTVVSQLEAARQAMAGQVPDLLLTAMLLPDGQGLDLVREICQRQRMVNSAIVLNSSDSSLEDLVAAGLAACLIQAPKKVRAEEILRVVHAVGPSVVATGSLAVPVDPAMRVQVVLDAGRIPDALAGLIRELSLFNVEVSVNPTGVPAVDPATSLVLILRRTDVPKESAGFAGLTQLAGDLGATIAVLAIDQGRLMLRAVRRNAVVAICQRPFDATRLGCLLQSGRP